MLVEYLFQNKSRVRTLIMGSYTPDVFDPSNPSYFLNFITKKKVYIEIYLKNINVFIVLDYICIYFIFYLKKEKKLLILNSPHH